VGTEEKLLSVSSIPTPFQIGESQPHHHLHPALLFPLEYDRRKIVSVDNGVRRGSQKRVAGVHPGMRLSEVVLCPFARGAVNVMSGTPNYCRKPALQDHTLFFDFPISAEMG
jgi:hypothetical protein